MIRLVGIVLVIWGLIFQPLVMSMPVNMNHHGSDAAATFDVDENSHVDEHSNHHAKEVGDKTGEAQSYGRVSDDRTTSEKHDDCASDCANAGNCCGVCTASLNHEVIVPSEQQISTPIFGNAEHLVLGILSSIYHPPKQA